MGLRFLFVAFLLFGLVHCYPFKSEEVENYNKGLKIINGNFTTISQHPIQVAYLIANNIWGAGVIIGRNWVLTTAFNCLWVNPSYISVRAGSSNWTTGGVVLTAKKCTMHPEYKGTWANNIALVELAQNVPWEQNIKKGFYNTPETLNIPDSSYNVSGWGVRSSSFQKETQLQYVSQTILSTEECSKYYNLTEAAGSFCASNVNGGPCVFDYGAPMNLKRFVVGLYQGSIDCTKPETYPSLYVDVFPYIDWITSVIGQ